MRFLADAGISPKTVDFLKQLGHDATHVRTLGLQRAPDARVVDRARTDGSIVLSFDLDFGDILALGVMDKPSAISSGSPMNAPIPSTRGCQQC
jgi:predicted nuclease of predicted toxin-antitoxin system